MANQFVRNTTREQPVCVKITDGTREDHLTIYPGIGKIPEGWKVVTTEFQTYKRQLSDVSKVMQEKKAQEQDAKKTILAQKANMRNKVHEARGKSVITKVNSN